MLRFKHGMRPRRIQAPQGAGPEGRLKRLRQIVTGLIRYERVEPTYAQADEARQYAERLIYLAIKNGDKHQETMDLADYWLLEKDLVHKLFKVLVPRYENYKTCFTDLHKMAVEYPGHGRARGVLELRGHPWPPVIPKQRDTRYLLSNILIAGARKDYHNNKQKQQAAVEGGQERTTTTSASSGAETTTSSCVDTGVQDNGTGEQQIGSSVDGDDVVADSSKKPTQNTTDR